MTYIQDLAKPSECFSSSDSDWQIYEQIWANWLCSQDIITDFLNVNHFQFSMDRLKQEFNILSNYLFCCMVCDDNYSDLQNNYCNGIADLK